VRRIPDLLVPLAVLAAGLALVAPSHAVARRSDVLLAALVLFSALSLAPSRLVALRARWREVAALSVLPMLVLAPLAWLVGRPFGDAVRHGTLSLGLAATEVATIGLAGLIGDAALAAAAVTGSLVVSAVLGPIGAALLAGGGTHADTGHLLGRFALIVLAPLAAGGAIRALRPTLERHTASFDAAATLAVVALVYAALSGTSRGHDLAPALAASALFLAASGLLALAWARLAPRPAGATGALAFWLRDFAVAATLAIQAFSPRAGTVPGVYGVLMLIGGATAASVLRWRAQSTTR
jgi:predicted Na+-dependent transporter